VQLFYKINDHAFNKQDKSLDMYGVSE